MKLPLAEFIDRRLSDLGLDWERLGYRLGYTNPVKARGRIQALRDGFVKSPKSIRALRRLAEALESEPDEVATAVAETQRILDEREAARRDAIRRVAETQRILDEREAARRDAIRREREAEDARWRARFEPHAIIHTSETVPTSITMVAFGGGPDRWLKIPFDTSQSPVTFARQALVAIPTMVRKDADGRLNVPFFGHALGFIVNYTPDHAIRFDLNGTPIETLDAARRPGVTSITLGRRPLTPDEIRWFTGA